MLAHTRFGKAAAFSSGGVRAPTQAASAKLVQGKSCKNGQSSHTSSYASRLRLGVDDYAACSVPVKVAQTPAQHPAWASMLAEGLLSKAYSQADIKTLALGHEAIIVCANHGTSADFAVMQRVLEKNAGIDRVLLLSTPVAARNSGSAFTQPLHMEPGISSRPAQPPGDRAHMSGNVIHIPRGWRTGLTNADVDFIQLAVRTVATPTWSGRPKPVALVIFPEHVMHSPEATELNFQVSVAWLASKLQYPVVPTFISQESGWTPLSLLPLPKRLVVEMGVPVRPPVDSAAEIDRELGDAELFVNMQRAAALSSYDQRLRAMMVTLRASVRLKATQRWPDMAIKRRAGSHVHPGASGARGRAQLGFMFASVLVSQALASIKGLLAIALFGLMSLPALAMAGVPRSSNDSNKGGFVRASTPAP